MTDVPDIAQRHNLPDPLDDLVSWLCREAGIDESCCAAEAVAVLKGEHAQHLRKQDERVSELLAKNNEILERARVAERRLADEKDLVALLRRSFHDRGNKLAEIHKLLIAIDMRLGTLSVPTDVKAVTVEMLTDELRNDLSEALSLSEDEE